MKRRIATLLALALSTTLLLGGCGGSSDTETKNDDSGNSSGGFMSEITDTKSEVLSEVLSTGKIIAYKVDSVDKAETPDNIYFFDNGKVTIIPGEEFGLTMGDFAKMSDNEIWEKYQTVKEAYCESYIKQQKEKWQENIDSMNADMKQYKAEAIWMLHGFSDAEEMPLELQEIWAEAEVDGTIANEVIDSAYETVMAIAREKEDIYGEFEHYEVGVAESQDEIEKLQSLIDRTDYKLPFVEIPFSFLVLTDSTGNNVGSVEMVYLTQSASLGGEIPKYLYDTLGFARGLTGEEVIYDTTYNCIATSGSGSFLTREVMDIDDTLDSSYILIDSELEEINEYFKDEFISRYE